MGTHKHHIIPKHMGGTDASENIVELTVEEHAEAHRKLFEEYGSMYDYIAWKALSGQITTDDARRLATIATWTGRKHTEETKEKIKDARSRQIISEETRRKMSSARKGRKLTWDTKSQTEEANKKRSLTASGKPKPKIICPHCGKEGGLPQMKQWHFDNCKERAF